MNAEIRPEQILGRTLLVTDLSPLIRERLAGQSYVIALKDLALENSDILIGFGKPNVFLIFNYQGKWLKFSGKSIKRAPAYLAETQGLAQSGIFMRVKNAPAHLLANIYQACLLHSGQYFWTCVNAVCNVLQEAGLVSGDKPLATTYLPITLSTKLMDFGLTFEHQILPYEVLRTTPQSSELHAREVFISELNSLCRHTLFKKSFKPSPRDARHPIAPQLPELKYKNDLDLSISNPAPITLPLRWIWGNHTIFRLTQTRILLDDYLSDSLKAFPQSNPSLLTRIKKNLLFNPLITNLITIFLKNSEHELTKQSESNVYNMLRTSTPSYPAKYNIVLIGQSIYLARISVGIGFVDWILSKHVLVSNHAKDVRFAGELWKEANGDLILTNNSGTYRPTNEQLDSARKYLVAIFPNLPFATCI